MRRRSVEFSPEAIDDLNALYDWIADAGSEQAALLFVERIERYCLGFDLASERGRKITDRRGELRAVGFRRQATVLFRVSDDRVTIVRVFRAGLDWTSQN